MYEITKLTADVNVNEYYKDYVDFEKFSKICEQEQEKSGLNWNYPPFDFDPDEYWESYNKLKIIAFKIDFDDEDLAVTHNDKELDFILKRFERIKTKFMNEIYALEDEDSVALYLGKCSLCMRCTREFGMPCKMPFKLRYSLESLGGDIERTVEDIFGFKIQYPEDGKLPPYLIFVGGLLYDKK